ncbi:MAG: YkgJ family cysteine cluster protein [Planctomycetes bacterium]|nr:YkgJ family cysteine cluster protein [Planctomycetota bacterium]
MASVRLTLPILQNWDCHNCGGCCRQHQIEITEAERQKILSQNWTAEDGIPGGKTMVRMGGWLSSAGYRLAHQADGACVFLNENGLCRIHAKFGESGKPLACRVYPYAFHPAGKSVAVSLRFSCPSVVKNAGRPVHQQQSEIRTIADMVVPTGAPSMPAPPLNVLDRVDWPDFHRFVDALDATLAQPNIPLGDRLLQAIVWTSLVGQSSFTKLRGERIRDFLELVQEAARVEAPTLQTAGTEPTAVGRLYFRLLVAQYARKDTAADLREGWIGRWRLLRAVWKFSRGEGEIPPLQDLFRSVKFAEVEQSFGGLTPEQEEIFCRYFRVKVQGLHFCGPAYYDVPFVEGFHSLALILPVTLWIARWLAAGDQRTRLTTDDVARALAIVDHHHGYSPALGQRAARSRVRSLSESGDLIRLVLRFTR